MYLTERQILALSQAAFLQLEEEGVKVNNRAGYASAAEMWISDVLDHPHYTEQSQTVTAIAVTTLINAD